MDIMDFTAVGLGKKIRSGEIGVREAAEAALENIEKRDPLYHAYLNVDREKTLKRADEVQKGIKDGTYASPLAGVPAAIKDNLCLAGWETTCASRILSGFKPTYTAEAVENLLRAGTVILGKTNMDEFAMGSTTETSAFGPTKIPGIYSMFPAVPPVVRWQRSQRANAFLRSEATPAVPSGNPAPTAA